MDARMGRYMRLGSSSSKATAAGIAVVCAFMVLAGCGGSSGSATDAAAPVIRGDGTTASPSAIIWTVTFDANGGTGTMASQTASTSTALTSNAFTRSGYEFNGWATTPDRAKEYPNTGKYPFTESDTLYARWKCCIVTFNANGGTGTMPSQTASTATALTANTFTKDNFSFEGWKNAESTLLDRAVYPFDEPATLKAQWQCLMYDPFYGEIFTLTAKRVSNNAATVQLGVRGAGGVSGWKKFKATSYNDFNNGDNQTQSTTVTSDTWGDWPPIICVTGLDKGKKYVFQVLGTTESGCTYQSQVSNTISKW